MNGLSKSLFTGLLVMATVTLVAMSATPCPTAGTLVALRNSTSLDYVNCGVLINVSGVNIVNVFVSFTNSAPGFLNLSGAILVNFSVRVVQSNVGAMILSANISQLVSRFAFVVDRVPSAAAQPSTNTSLVTMVLGKSSNFSSVNDFLLDASASFFNRPLFSVTAISRNSSITGLSIRLANTTCIVVGGEILRFQSSFSVLSNVSVSLVAGSNVSTAGSIFSVMSLLATNGGISNVTLVVSENTTVSTNTGSVLALNATRFYSLACTLSAANVTTNASIITFVRYSTEVATNLTLSISQAKLVSPDGVVAIWESKVPLMIKHVILQAIQSSISTYSGAFAIRPNPSTGRTKVRELSDVHLSFDQVILTAIEGFSCGVDNSAGGDNVLLNSSLVMRNSNAILNGYLMDFVSFTHVTSIVLILDNSSCYSCSLIGIALDETKVPRTINSIYLSVLSSVMTPPPEKMALTIVSIANASSVGIIEAVFDAASVTFITSFFGFGNLSDVVGPISVTVRNHSKIICNVPATSLASTFLAVRTVLRVRGPLTVSLGDSLVGMTVNTPNNSFSLLLAHFSLLTVDAEAGGMIHVLMTNTSIMLSQSNPLVIDICGIISLAVVSSTFRRTKVLSSDSSAIQIDIVNSVVSISCHAVAALLLCQHSKNLGDINVSATGRSNLTIYASTVYQLLDQQAWFFGPLTIGSFVFMLVNSNVANMTGIFQDSIIRCGVICEVAGVHRSSGAVYDKIMIAALGVVPPVPNPLGLTAATFFLNNCTVSFFPAAPTSKVQLRSLFLLTNMTSTSITVKGPFLVKEGGFDRFVAVVGGGDQGNKLVFSSCDLIFAADAKGAETLLVHTDLVPTTGEASRGISIESIRSSGAGSCGATSSHSLPPSDSLASFTFTSSLSGTPSTFVNLPRRKPSLPVPRVVLAGAVSGVVLVGGPAVAASVQAMHAQMLVTACGVADDDAQPDFPTSPTQMAFGPAAGEYDRGTVLGNVLLLAACCLIATLAVVFVRRSAADMSLPGLLYLPYSMLFVPTLTSAVTLSIEQPAGAGDLVLSFVGFISAIAPLMLLAVFATVRFGARAYRSPAPRRYHGSPLKQHLVEWYHNITAYSSLADSPGFVEKWDFAGITDYLGNRQWFVVLELAVGVVTGSMAGVASSAAGVHWCTTLNAVQTIVTTAFFALVLILRPYGVRATRWTAVGNGCLMSIAAIAGLTGRDVSFGCSVMQVALSALSTGGYIAWRLLDGFGGLLLPPHKLNSSRAVKSKEVARRRKDLVLKSDELHRLLLEIDTRERNVYGALKILITAICADERRLPSSS